jgi:hypothetical protein
MVQTVYVMQAITQSDKMSVGYVKGVHTGMVTVVVMMILHTVHKDTSGQVHNVLVVVLAVE